MSKKAEGSNAFAKLLRSLSKRIETRDIESLAESVEATFEFQGTENLDGNLSLEDQAAKQRELDEIMEI